MSLDPQGACGLVREVSLVVVCFGLSDDADKAVSAFAFDLLKYTLASQQWCCSMADAERIDQTKLTYLTHMVSLGFVQLGVCSQ